MPKEKNVFDPSAFALPEMDFSKVNETFRDFAEKGVEQNKEFYAKMRETAEGASKTVEETYDAMVAATTDMTGKAIENAKTNMDASYKFFENATKAKSVAELLELQSTFFRTQFDAFSKQAKEGQELVVKHGENAFAPAKAAMEKTAA